MLDEALATAGVRETFAAYDEVSAGIGTIWLATDIGLIRSDATSENATRLNTPAAVKLEICPWVDVVNPELTVEATSMEAGPSNMIVTFHVQLPRVALRATGDPRPGSAPMILGTFAAAVLRRSGH